MIGSDDGPGICYVVQKDFWAIGTASRLGKSNNFPRKLILVFFVFNIPPFYDTLFIC